MTAMLLAQPCVQAADTGFPLLQSFTAIEVGTDVLGLSAVQDSDGVLYFGSNGLLVFDGEQWKSRPINGSYGFYGLDFGPDGKLWAGGFGEIGWFDRADGAWKYNSLRPHLRPEDEDLGAVLEAQAHGSGAVFAATDRLLIWDGKSFRSWAMPGSRYLRLLRSGEEVFAQHPLAGLYVIRGNEPHLVLSAETLGKRSVFWMEARGADLVVLTNEGFFQLKKGVLEALDTPASDYIRRHPPTRVLTAPDGRLVVGTVDDGAVIVDRDGAVVSALNRRTGLETGYVVPLLVDRDGALWAGTRAAIVRLALDSSSTVFDSRAGLTVEPITKIARHNGDLLVTNSSGLHRLNGHEGRFELLNRGFVNDIQSTPAGLLVAGYNRVSLFAGGAASVVFDAGLDLKVLASSLHEPGTVYAGGLNTVLAVPASGAVRTVVAGFADVPNSIVEDQSGFLWIGTKARGLFVARLGSSPAVAQRVGEAYGISNPHGTARVLSLPDGGLLIFTPAGAWFRAVGGDAFTPVEQAPARSSRVAAVDPDGSGAWVIYEGDLHEAATVAYIRLHAGGATCEPHSIEGVGSVGVPSAMFAERGKASSVLWIGGTHGVLRHELSRGAGVPIPRAPLVRAMARVGNDVIDAVLARRLPPSTRSIEFEFALPEYGRRGELRIQSRIDGIDPDWVPVGAGSRRELNLVRPGEYTIRARAVANSRQISGETVLTFDVLKPWWQTATARTGAVLAIGLAAFGVYRVRVRTLRRRNVELEAKVRQRTEELERASAAKTEFVANMSHDIRNPLNGIVGLAYALEDSRLDERQRDMVATLRECTSYLSTLVDDVLDFASIEAGRVEIRPGPFNAAELLGSIATTLKADTIQSGATLVVECDPALPPHVLGDAGRIQQILVNYVSNALKYAGGTIRLSATLPTHATDEIEFAVTDFGPGLSDSEKATLFTKFTRTAQARQHAVPGTGLGLAACRSLADFMGGSVGVISQPGEGASFFLRLPLIVATERPAEPTRALPNATVLLVEDTDYNALAATAVLERLGLSCERACTGEEAIRLFSEKRYNIVLLDRNLPDMDGTDVARRLRAIEGDGLRSILLAVTAYCTPEDRTRCIEAGMDAFVGKPLTPEKLRKVLLTAGRTMRSTSTLALHDDTPAPVGELDTTLLSYLSDGSQSGLMQQIGRYVANLERTQRELAQKMAAGDGEALANTAHRLLGDARMINATALISAVTALENSARHGRLAECRGRLELVMTEIARVTEALYRQSAARTT